MTFTQEQKDFWRKWIDALKSGDFRQGRMRLKDVTGGFCCLGVACDITGKGTWSESYIFEIVTNPEYGDIEHWQAEPDFGEFDRWIGYTEKVDNPLSQTDEEGGWPPDYIPTICMTLNDDAEWNFEQIANWLEQLAIELGVFDA